MSSETQNPQSASDADIWSIEGLDDSEIQELQPAFLARGGEHIVYTIPSMPGVVAKVDAAALKHSILRSIERGHPPHELPNKEEALRSLKNQRQRYRTMRSHFGKEHVLPQAKMLMKVPVSQAMLREIFQGDPPVHTDSAWTFVTLQKKANELQDKDRLNLLAGYSEGEPEKFDKDSYNDVSTRILRGTETSITQDEFLGIQGNDFLQLLVEKSESDPELKEVLRQLIRSCISYTQATGEMLDLAGNDNLIINKRDGKWSYRLLDALYPGGSDTIEQTQGVFRSLAEGKPLSHQDQICLLNAVNYARTINGLAMLLNIPERITIVPEDIGDAPIDFLRAITSNEWETREGGDQTDVILEVQKTLADGRNQVIEKLRNL